MKSLFSQHASGFPLLWGFFGFLSYGLIVFHPVPQVFHLLQMFCGFRETSRPSQPSLKLPVATSRPRSSSSQLTETSRRLGKRLALTTKAKLCTQTSFSHGLEPTRSRRIHSNKQAAGFPYCCLSSWRLSLRLDGSQTKDCAGTLSSNTKLRTWTPLRGLRHTLDVLFPQLLHFGAFLH